MPKVLVKEGVYRLKGEYTSMEGMQFELVEGFRVDSPSGSGYFTVDGTSASPQGKFIFPPRKLRIRCSGPAAFEYVSGSPSEVYTPHLNLEPEEPAVPESDEEIIERLRVRFDVLKEMTSAVKVGKVKALILVGPPGVGKSHGVNEVLFRSGLLDSLGSIKPKYEVVKGAMSALGLYQKLYEFSESKNVLVLDDCDSMFFDDVALNILKAALDTTKSRTISWNTDSRVLKSDGIPTKFEFKGGVIFITNLKFSNVRSKKLQDHLAALESRCHYIDLQIDTDREKMLRIKQIVKDGMLDEYELDDSDKESIVEFIDENREGMRELSLRTVLKCADLHQSFPERWKEVAKITVMKR